MVVTYNSAAEITSCLASLRGANVAVRVVDNASADDTAAVVAARFPEVTLVKNDENVGFAAAVNQTLATVDTEVVLLVNPDCVLDEGAAAVLVATLAGTPDVGVAGPRIVGPDGGVRNSANTFESWASVLVGKFGGSLLPIRLRRLVCVGRRRRTYAACLREPDGPVAVDWLSGACLALRTSLVRDLGGLDARYFMYYEDEDLCLRAWQRGLRVLYQPSARAMHVGGASSSDDPASTWPHFYRSMLRFFALHRPGSYSVVRAAVLLRAAVGVATGCAQVLARSPGSRKKVRAWAEVARSSATAGPKAVERPARCTY